jgi:hypothetical protein
LLGVHRTRIYRKLERESVPSVSPATVETHSS